MKTHWQQIIGMAVLGMALGANTIPAWAGATTVNEVFIRVDGRSARGSLPAARYSGDSKQFITCSAESFSGRLANLPTLVECQAGDRNGKIIYCNSSDPRMADAVKGMTDASNIYFTVDSVTGRCADLEITNSSEYLR